MFKRIFRFFANISPAVGIGIQIGVIILTFYLVELTRQVLAGGLGLMGILSLIFLLPITVGVTFGTIGVMVDQSIRNFASRKWYWIVLQVLILAGTLIAGLIIYL